jgi:hypothetical protein
MEALTLAKVNTTNTQDDAYDMGMTQEDYASICEGLKQKSRGLISQLYKTFRKRIELHTVFKLTREDYEAVFRFNQCIIEHANCLLRQMYQFVSMLDRY